MASVHEIACADPIETSVSIFHHIHYIHMDFYEEGGAWSNLLSVRMFRHNEDNEEGFPACELSCGELVEFEIETLYRKWYKGVINYCCLV